MGLLFISIANRKSLVCKHAIANNDYTEIVESYLLRNPSDGHLFYGQDGQGVHALTVADISVVAVTTLDTPRQQAVQFINDVASNFGAKSERVEQTRFGQDGCLQRAYGGTLKSLADSFDQYKDNRQMAALQSEVDGVTNQLRQNVTELMRRGELAADVMDKTEQLESSAGMFKTTSRKVERKMWYENFRMRVILIGVGVALFLVILLIILWQTGAFESKKK